MSDRVLVSGDPGYDPFKDPVLLAEAAAIFRRAMARREARLVAERDAQEAS